MRWSYVLITYMVLYGSMHYLNIITIINTITNMIIAAHEFMTKARTLVTIDCELA